MRRLALGLVLFLAACGGTEPSTNPEIATLTTPPPATGAAAEPVTAAAPIIRPDTTWAEQRVMQQPFMKCVQGKGMTMATDEQGMLDLPAPDGRRDAFGDAKYADCLTLWPVPAPELDETKNPYWADDDENFHKCLVAGGKPLIKENGEWRPGPGFDTWEPNEAMELECQAKSYDGKKG